jgi:serine protease Do
MNVLWMKRSGTVQQVLDSITQNPALAYNSVLTTIRSAADVAQALSSVPNGQDALVLVWSNGGSTFRVLHPSQG